MNLLLLFIIGFNYYFCRKLKKVTVKKSSVIIVLSLFFICAISCSKGGYSSSHAQNKMHRVNKYHGYPKAVSSKRR